MLKSVSTLQKKRGSIPVNGILGKKIHSGGNPERCNEKQLKPDTAIFYVSGLFMSIVGFNKVTRLLFKNHLRGEVLVKSCSDHGLYQYAPKMNKYS